MKHSQFTHLLFGVSLAIFLISCGGSGNEKTSTADSTAMADSTAKAEKAAAEAKAMSTIITTTQYFVVVTHKVANYAKWLASYEGHDSARLANGLHNFVIGRGLKDSNMVLVALKADDTSKAKAFSKDPGLKKAMQKGGVVGTPMISFTTSNWQDTAIIDSKLRSRTTIMVKDWDVWLKAFQDGKQARMDNGILDRNISHDLDNNKKVSLVVALTDTAKAMAYWKSDELKKRMENSGMIGEPIRFLYRVVKRY